MHGKDTLVEFWTGALAASVDVVIFHSVDTLKVRAQDRRLLLPWDTLKARPLWTRPAIALRSLYAGFSTNFSLKIPYMAFMFGFHAFNRQILGTLFPDESKENLKLAVSALLVGTQVSALLGPLELVRTQGQNCGKGGILSATKYVNGLGTSSFGRGMVPTIHREAKYCFGQFFMQVWMSTELQKWIDENRSNNAISGFLSQHPIVVQILSAASCGFLCTIISHPDDVVKTRMQTHLRDSSKFTLYSSYSQTMWYLLKNEGFSSLYRGWIFRCCIRVPLGLSVIVCSSQFFRPYVQHFFRGTDNTTEHHLS